jgi:DNA-binding PadR family transcriptional regulator
MAKKNKTKFALLGMLTFRPMSGYDIKKHTDHTIGYFWHENYGHIYPVLKKMLEQDLVLCEMFENPGAPPRKVYSITKKGTDQFKEWLKEDIEPENYRKELLLKIFFADNNSKENIREKLICEREHHSDLLKQYRQVESHLLMQKDEENYSPFWVMTVRNGIFTSEAQLNWCKDTLVQLENI